MAILFADGFDQYLNGTTDFVVTGTGWIRSGTASHAQIDADGGRFGGGALALTTSDTSYAYCEPTMAVGDTVHVGFAFKYLGEATVVEDLVGFFTAAPARLGLVGFAGTGHFRFTQQPTTITYGTVAACPPNVWHWVEIRITFGTGAADGAIEVRVNGTTVLSAASIDTNNGSAPTQIRFYAGTQQKFIDDVIIFNTSGSAPNTWIGDSRVETIRPDGDAATVDWTASAGADYTTVDETVANDDTDYIASQTSAQESRFSMSALGSTYSSIYFLQTNSRGRRVDTVSSRSYRTLINSSGTESVGTTHTDPGTTYLWRKGGFFVTDPNTAAAWGSSGVNAVEVGVEII